jgi:D-threo-aldose 1-dehydrogenase
VDPSATRIVGSSGVAVTQLGFGGASMGELNRIVPEADALGAVERAWDGGVRYFDTAPWYGRGLSELRTGAGLRGRSRDEFVLSTKVGRWLRPTGAPDRFDRTPWTGGLPFEVVFDYSYDGIMRSFEQSQLRLGLDGYDLAIIHDLDLLYHAPESRWWAYMDQLSTSGWRALAQLRSEGRIRGIGAGINTMGMIPRFLDLLPLDFFLIAMPYTLLRQDVLDEEFPRCEREGVGFVIGAVYQSGILASGPVEGAHHDYAPAPPDVIERVRAIQAVCERHGVPLAAAALQFPLGHPSVASVIPGASSAGQVDRTLAAFRHYIPGALWEELKHERLLREDAPVPAGAPR